MATEKQIVIATELMQEASNGGGFFMRRGYDTCSREWKFICAAHNLFKLQRCMYREALEALKALGEANNFEYAR